uniref:Uncharacterized protein n=1 Tax=Peronospora matthiolae TaxID=2874970 RepID=A0AAV1UZV0_9STRA
MAGLYVLTLDVVAFIGFLCALLSVLLPLLVSVLRLLLVDVPQGWRNWLLHRAQQRELQRLQSRVDALIVKKQMQEQQTRRRLRAPSAEKRRMD